MVRRGRCVARGVAPGYLADAAAANQVESLPRCVGASHFVAAESAGSTPRRPREGREADFFKSQRSQGAAGGWVESGEIKMKLSARNVLRATVRTVTTRLF